MQEREQRLTLMYDYCILVETHSTTLSSVAVTVCTCCGLYSAWHLCTFTQLWGKLLLGEKIHIGGKDTPTGSCKIPQVLAGTQLRNQELSVSLIKANGSQGKTCSEALNLKPEEDQLWMPLIKGPEGLCTWFLRLKVTSAHECFPRLCWWLGWSLQAAQNPQALGNKWSECNVGFHVKISSVRNRHSWEVTFVTRLQSNLL